MGRKRKDSFIKFGEKLRKRIRQKKIAKAKEEARAKRKARKKHQKEFRKFIAEERKKTIIEHN